MTTVKNLIGKTFGTLIVIQRAGSNREGKALWLCRCICGEERVAVGKDLGKKITRCPKKCILTEDLTGQRIGNLLVIKQEGSDKHGFRQFRCRCITPMTDLRDEYLQDERAIQQKYCNNEILINATSLRQDLKNKRKRKIPRSCFKCSRILSGKLYRKTYPLEDLTGQIFGRLTAVRKIHRKSGKTRLTKRVLYECICSCGSSSITCVRQEALIGKTVKAIRSCGCLQREYAKQNKNNFIHGLSAHPLYDILLNIIRRCFDQNCPAFPRYGGRGITVCDEWLREFILFYNWAIESGWQKGLTIDRIDNNGPYSPANCRFVTRTENALKMHRDHNTAFQVYARQYNINELSKKFNVSAELCKKLLRNGYDEEDVCNYGKLQPHQKLAVSKAIHKGTPISIQEAKYKRRKTKIIPRQSSEMGSYRAMMARCYNAKTPSYRYYGAKGIKVCTRWKNNPQQFLQDMGPKPEPKKEYAIDRKDSKKNYCQENCQWLHISDNSRRVSRKNKLDGVTLWSDPHLDRTT